MITVGLTGGLACGKSFVASALGQLGCYVLEADEVAREAMAPGGEAYDSVVAAFGTEILDENGFINRPRLGARVFGDPEQLARLNALVHPGVREHARRRFREIGARDPGAVIVYVAAILIESGAYREVDKMIVVHCSRAQQIERAMQRPGATESDVLARLDRQMPMEEKRLYGDYLIDTGGTKEDTLRQISNVYQDLRRLAS